MTPGAGELCGRRPDFIASSAVALALIATQACAVAPTDDCGAKATCVALPNATAGGVNATSDVSDASLDVESGAFGRPPLGASDGGAIDAPSESPGYADAAIDAPREGEVEDDGSGDVASCRAGYQCAPPVPGPWFGPMAFWWADADYPAPGCPPGYFWPFEVWQGLSAPPAVCASACIATGQQCAASVSVFSDSSCLSPCFSGAVSTACTAVTGCSGNQGTVQADAPAPFGGTCVPSVLATVPPATWATVARMCWLSSPSLACANGNGSCVPNPAPPYPSRTCIAAPFPDPTRIPSACPSSYPYGPSVYYQNFVDSRGCSAASCSGTGPTGGSCGGTAELSGARTGPCTVGAFSYAIGSGCSSAFTLPGPVSQIRASYTLTPGSCSVGADAQPTGLARPSGPAHVVCCM